MNAKENAVSAEQTAPTPNADELNPLETEQIVGGLIAPPGRPGTN